MTKQLRLVVIAGLMSLAAGALLADDSKKSGNGDDNGRGSRIKHVFVITLENEAYDATFGPTSKAPYLSQTLVSKGALLTQYYGTSHVSLGNYISMISGQAANPVTNLDCTTYTEFISTGTTADGQAIGQGCVYPASVKTLADQLSAAGKTWRGYMEDMGNDPAREAATCGHPVLNTQDRTQSAEKPSTSVPLGDSYATRHNPFMYFHSIIDSPSCHTSVVNLNLLSDDLKSISTTPNFAFVKANLCHDGHDAPCANGEAGGLISADAFLQKWIPLIMASPAYQKDGLIIIHFDEGGFTVKSNGSGGFIVAAEGETCCSQRKGPNLGTYPVSQALGAFTLSFGSYGGDRVGAVLLSPFVKPGTVSNTPFNHYSFLKSMEDIFGLDYLGYAGAPGLISFFGCSSSDVTTIKGLNQGSGCGE